MKEYLIQGLLGVEPEFVLGSDTSDTPPREDGRCLTNGYEPVGTGYRILMWDKDNFFDDRLGVGTTRSFFASSIPEKHIKPNSRLIVNPTISEWGKGNYFEITISDEAFRQESGEIETIDNAEIYVEVFYKNRFLFRTDNFEPGEYKTLPVHRGEDGKCYAVILSISAIETEEPEPEPLPRKIEPPEDRVVDILPTADQIADLGVRRTSATTSTNVLGGSLQQVVDNAFGQVLGQTFSNFDVDNFSNSLSQTFAIKENNGQRAISYSPRSYINKTQTELGGMITGAQASLYHRAKVALKEILPLLDGIYELETDSDEQNQEAIRSIIRTEITEVVREMGIPQGPRVQRVDSLFELIIGDESESTLPEQIGGQLRDFRKEFGLERGKINTVEEEQNYGNFLIIRDYIVSLRESWQDYVSLQTSGAGSFIGTQLVLLSQALSVMAESVRETYHIMDLVFLGAEERESVLIDFTKAKDTKDTTLDSDIAFLLPNGVPYFVDQVRQLVPPMEVEKLMSWAMRFATEEAPTLAKTAGKLGIAKIIAKTAKTLVILIQAASYVNVPNNAFRREGVKRALRDLAFQTYRVQQLAEELIPPLLSGESDDTSDNNGTNRNRFSTISTSTKRQTRD